ncbi:uncharacterized protein LOC131217234 isoform X2 [Magnolia sinica]|uniref:uncharacterized protein LOC131217234 isoform X2 n=1 Tax=Magnolia sinica TaxID=86752 RepID=UPI00265A1684|nr:uncharacterized protein LOC131217234 isoform X2 [Magnolia sinica]
METQTPHNKGKSKRARVSPPISDHHLFAQMLAAYANIQTPFSQSLLLKCLQKIHLSLLQPQLPQQSSLHEFLPDALLSLLPFLLNTKSVYCQIATVPIKSVSHCIVEKGSNNHSKIRVVENKLLVLVLEAGSTLINTCSAELLERIPGELSVTSLFYLKEIWAEVQGRGADSNQERSCSCSNIQTLDLAETIFRLAMNRHPYTTCTSDAVQRSIFGGVESDFEHFILNYWEDSPLLLRRASKTSDDKDDIFSLLVRSFNSKTIDAILVSLLGGLVACPPIASDELDILSFLKYVKGGLGCPIMYGQDIRVVKTVELVSTPEQGHLKKELHLLKDGMGFSAIKSLEFTDSDHVQKCKEAFHNGYTIALRGMEFRSENVSAIADRLEMLFGQPSVGANLYLTPPRSQGLARHADDHCVFVCQLLGKKKWAVFPRLTAQLPRLYEPVSGMPGLEVGCDAHVGKKFLLSEGDILYIPRGCPHEAHTIPDDGESQIDETTGFSLHLTLGIEVEPPFEWEGFAHVALHCWNQNKNQTAHDAINSTSEIPNITFINLLHVAIRLIGDHDPTFRRACMVAAFSLPSDSGSEHRLFHALDLNQRIIFTYVIDRINTGSCFLEAFRTVEAAVRGKNDGSLQWMRWLRHLPQGATDEKTDFNNPLEAFEDLVLLHSGHTEEATATFRHVKTRFCTGIVYEDVSKSFEMLLKKYKKTRKQYTNGMLSLHCTK